MRKKIYDIKPPKVKKLESKGEELLVAKKSSFKKPKENIKKENRFPWKWISSGMVVALAFLVYLFFALPKADIDLWPKLDVLSFQDTIKADAKSQDINKQEMTAPAYYFELTKADSKDFPATGNASDEGFATGEITIYNKHQPFASVTLRPGTRFISDSGNLFLSTQKVVVPAAQKSGSKIIPGSVTVAVRAAESGKNYNIGSSTFSVPGFQGTAYFFDIYATSDKSMQGGDSGEIKKITDNDIQNAKDQFSKDFSAAAEDELRKKYEGEYIVVDDGFTSQVTFDSQMPKVGTVTPTFTLHASAKAGILTVKKSDVDNLIKNDLAGKMPEGKSLLDGSLKNDYLLSDVSFDNKTLTLNVNISAKIYQNMDKNTLTLLVLHQDENHINQSLTNELGDSLARVKVHFWPFWVSKSPNHQKAVHIHINFE